MAFGPDDLDGVREALRIELSSAADFRMRKAAEFPQDPRRPAPAPSGLGG